MFLIIWSEFNSFAIVDKLWDELWEADKRKKDERAEREAQEARDRNRVQTNILNEQLAAIDQSRQEEAMIRQQEQEYRVCFFRFRFI